MKKIHYILLILIVFLSACSKTEDDIFSKSAAERMNEALGTDYNLLTSAKNGWVMEYFANPLSPGYNLLVKFETSGQAIFAASNEYTANQSYETDSCLFQMIGDDGPVLTFNSFNKILHVFSNPVDPKGSRDLDGYGLEGDYEFVVMKADAEKIILRGKKYRATVILTKLPENVYWTNYATDLSTMSSLMFSANTPKLTLTIGKSVYSFFNGGSYVFSVQKYGANITMMDVPFIVTLTGIRFYEPQDFEGNVVQTFNLNDEKSALVSVENPDIKLVGQEDLAFYFMSTIKTWGLVPEELSANMKALYDQIVESCVANYNAENVKLALKYNTTFGRFELSLAFEAGQIRNEGNLNLTITNSKNSLTISDKGTADDKGEVYRTEVSGLGELATLLSGSYALTTFAKINPQVIKLAKKTDASTWISIKLE